MAANAYPPGAVTLQENEGKLGVYADVWFQIYEQSHSNEIFKNIKCNGTLILTSRRFIWQNTDKTHRLRDFSATFGSIQKFALQQPIFGANYRKLKG